MAGFVSEGDIFTTLYTTAASHVYHTMLWATTAASKKYCCLAAAATGFGYQTKNH